MRWYLMGFAANGNLADGPWGYASEQAAHEAIARYAARASGEGGTAKLVAAESLDDLVERYADLVGERKGKAPLRGPRLLTHVDRRAKMFTPFGLAPSAPMSDEDAIAWPSSASATFC